MCGIAGIIGRLDESGRAALERMSAAMHHRGPDGHGTWESAPDEKGWGVLLAHRRLAILDLSEAGNQPMTDPVTGHTVVLNGEIYNYLTLRDELAAQGQTFRSSGDTAVLLRALGLQGREAVGRLRGMFTFASWDPSRRTLLLARDPLGIKPLYLARNPDPRGSWAVAFASELRALLASGLLGAPRLEPGAAASVIWNGFVVGPRTAIRGIELLPGGRLMELDGRGRELVSADFWPPEEPSRNVALKEEELAAHLEESVRLHLASDVPLAVFLSSGVDSSAVANLAQRTSGRQVHTFTLTFESAELNEGPIAREIAAAIGTEHREVLLTEGEFVEHLEEALDSLDQPTFDGLNSFFLSRAIRDAGFKVALVGTGGDELFGGYTSFRDLPALHLWSRRARFLPMALLASAAKLALSARNRGAPIPPQTRWAKLPDMIGRGNDLLGLYQLAYALFLPDFQNELLDGGTGTTPVDGIPAETRDRLLREIRSRSPLAALSVMEQRLFLGERLLRDNDVASMAASIEQRLPLVDQVLSRRVDELDETVRFQPVGRKELLRRIGLRGLPPSLFNRPKRGFVLPFDTWIRRGLRRAMDELMRDPDAARAAGLNPEGVSRLWKGFLAGAPGLYWSRVWAVFVLLRWSRRHGVVRQ
ncbi:asparagine synthase (glutamine-hydrolyzing) [Vulgatibacter incomptus]|uniref:asparagine synthase (glutamine-hydrolyzing) n=1 Tax=Vulgatibacter incomptus TaxID=1391653 RepID=A0A0K1P8L1_9BACT|nr:asparagine synthase (glutamine-hydrolyzing) [Vulgatibacter incomptus]AKU89842.1 Asparagine synthetase [Vulgatibacter incomptus]